jgi:hypothetical protein
MQIGEKQKHPNIDAELNVMTNCARSSTHT